MPTASGRPTADEKREADRVKRLAALQQLVAEIIDPAWLTEQVAAYPTTAKRAYEGTDTLELTYPAGEIYKVGRLEFDEGKIRAFAVSDAVNEAGFNSHNMMAFGIGDGRASIEYSVTEYRKTNS